ncbi:hypothetical protein PG987_013225 [Apiospora arundinis]
MEPAEKCGNPSCRLGDSVGTEKLMRCSGCHVTTYCSHACQKTHWRAHKLYCKHVATNGGTSEHLGHVEYHGHVASQDPSARALMRRIAMYCVASLLLDKTLLIISSSSSAKPARQVGSKIPKLCFASKLLLGLFLALCGTA